MPKLKIDLVVDGFREMDVDILDILLDDDKTYMRAYKETFLKKLNDAFEEFRASGDTALIPYRGHCRESRCPNNGCAGFSFVGNRSRKNLNFIFDELGNEINNINFCSAFSTNEKVKRKKRIEFDMSEDEKAPIYLTKYFSEKLEMSKLACQELYRYQNTIIGPSVYDSWLERHEQLYHQLFQRLNNSYHDEFCLLYSSIISVSGLLWTNDLAVKALEKYSLIDQNDEASIIQWLNDHDDDYGHSDIYSTLKDYDLDHPENIEYIKVQDLRIDASDYIPVIKFKILHCNLASQTNWKQSIDEAHADIDDNAAPSGLLI